MFRPRSVSDMIKQVFPLSERDRIGKGRSTHIIGISETDETVSNEQEYSDSHSSQCELLRENQRLRERIEELEQRLEPTSLERELKTLISPMHAIHHGPDSLEHFGRFSFDNLRLECKEHAPNVLSLQKILGNISRHESESDINHAEAKIIMVLASLAKCRSVKVQGIQLLISLMLIARSTSRQVSS